MGYKAVGDEVEVRMADYHSASGEVEEVHRKATGKWSDWTRVWD